jgi:predicted HD superfamily hydrolase involved in NAD metabolism
MHTRFRDLIHDQRWTGEVYADMRSLLTSYGYTNIAAHCAQVAVEAARLARQFDLDPTPAQVAGWLHDVSAVFPISQRADIARELGLEVLPQEAQAPMILHQKLSAAMAREMFQVADRGVLSAIACHTTLRVDAGPLDKVLFIADKVAWDQPGAPPYRRDVLAALECSLDRAAFVYLDYLWQQRASLLVVHPWMVAAHHQLAALLGEKE